jgi:glycosyltransferase involved in cell wall biosynthesis
MNTGDRCRFTIVMPVYNDWTPATCIVEELLEQGSAHGADVHIVLVDDASESATPDFHRGYGGNKVSVVRNDRNRGHQVSIATGLRFVQEQQTNGYIGIMDADGEDRVEDVFMLLKHCRGSSAYDVIFGARRSRVAPLSFHVMYRAYRLLHRCLLGVDMGVGHFCVMNEAALDRLLKYRTLELHIAETIIASDLSCRLVPVYRNARSHGSSHMSHQRLIRHGLTGIAVHGNRWRRRLAWSITGVYATLSLTALALCQITGLSCLFWLIAVVVSVLLPGFTLWFVLQRLAKI